MDCILTGLGWQGEIMASISFIGAGNMAEALIKGILQAHLYKSSNVHISRQIELVALQKLRKSLSPKQFELLTG